ncbi:MAG TPA: YdbL family protein [Allosphingosinicella sp.]
MRLLHAAAALALACCAMAGLAAAATQRTASELRATGLVGEQYDGYLGLVGSAPPRIRADMDAVNIRRRSYYTALARQRRAQIEEVAAATACEILATRVAPGEYYLLPGEAWRRREGTAPVPRPAYCR